MRFRSKKAGNNAEKNDSGSTVSWKNSIKTKLTLIMLCGVAIPMLLTAGMSYVTSTNKAIESAQESLNWEARYVEDLFAKMIDTNVSAMKAFSSAPSTIAYLRNPAAGAVLEKSMLAQMNSINEFLADGNQTVITDKDGLQVLRTDGITGVNVAGEDYYENGKASEGGIYVSNTAVSKGNGDRLITIAVAVRDTDGDFLGIVSRDYSLINLHDILAAECEDAFVADRNGLLAAHSQYTYGVDHEEESRATSEFMTSGKNSGFYTADTGKGYDAFISYVKEPNSQFTIVTAADSKTVLAEARSTALIILLISLVMIVVAGIVAVLTAGSYVKPVREVCDIVNRMTGGEISDESIEVKRKDEFGVMLRDINTFSNKLHAIVSGIKKSAAHVANSADELSDMTDQIAKTVDDVSNAVQDIATGASHQADEIETAVSATGTVDSSVTDIKTSTGSISESADEMNVASKTTSDAIDGLRSASAKTSEEIVDISDVIMATKNAVERISEKVEGITNIATQTNLLSLNASIEAARAGDAGRGFSVVAEEIGKLADNSKQLADEIRAEMISLLERSDAAVAAVGGVQSSNEETRAALEKSLESVEKMIAEIDKTVQGIESISEATDKSITAKNSVVDTMSALSAISQQNAASAEETGAAMEELDATVVNLNESSGKLKDIADSLSRDMEFFKL
ncbi:MAG: HAMP domain-containing protein [Lachnospiraceae bacterium]|nr:HAMP domain-containing protein [Lachnospiraceae bacterium]